MMQSDLDRAVLESFPMVTAPLVGDLPLPAKHGTRFIASERGLVREVSTDWLIHRRLVAPARLPYGPLEDGFDFKTLPPPKFLWRVFVDNARQALPNECAGVMIYNTTTQAWRLSMREETFASQDRCDYIEPEIADDEIKVVDIHSHGDAPAFFSRTDDVDDRGGIKVSAVVGNVASERPQVVLRLVTLDEFTPLSMAEDGSFKEKT